MRKNNVLHKCRDCTHATILMWKNDPLIAACKMKNGERFVANASTLCDVWEKRRGAAVVIEMD